MMTIKHIPLSPIPYQTVSIVINGQNYSVIVRQLGSALFSSVFIDGEVVAENVLARAGGRLIPWAQTKAHTQLFWQDFQGNDNPHYKGLSDRWLICYEATE